jgi:dTDP-4-dehydrorhamnose 3,5-epimerase
MRIEALPLDGAFLLIPEPIADDRGSFSRVFDRAVMGQHGLETEFPEWSLSRNAKAGTLRGLHWQADPHWEVKLVHCVQGAIFDVVVDVRPNSPTFGRWYGEVLSGENQRVLYCPRGFAHGFQSLTDNADIYYHISEPYRAGGARGLRWDDPEVGVAWPRADRRIVSDRDAALPLLSAIRAGA